MRKSLNFFIPLLLAGSLIFSGQAGAACRNPNLVFNGNFLKSNLMFSGDPLFIRLAAAGSGFVEIQWFGHSFFQITSGEGTRIITDPFGTRLGFPLPEVWPHVVTVGRDTGNHNNVELANGDPVVLYGITGRWGSNGWNEINTTVRDVLIYNVPIYTRAWHEFIQGAGFVFEMDGLCVFHTGDVGEPFNEDQLDLIGHVDVLLLPIGGSYTMGPDNALKVMEQIKPKIAVPMHYLPGSYVLERFLAGPYPSRFLETDKFRVSKDTLPKGTEIFIPRVPWYGRGD